MKNAKNRLIALVNCLVSVNAAMDGESVQDKPDEVLDESDPGDDVQTRFHYQHSCAAILALSLIRDGSEIDLVLCENHEDIVVRHTNGKWTAIQIKTRDLTQQPFKATDPQVIKAFRRFVSLERKFPGAFEHYEFVTNFAFWEESESLHNLKFVLGAIRDRGSVSGLRKNNASRAWVTEIVQGTDMTEAEVVAIVRKCEAKSHANSVTSGRSTVQEALCEFEQFLCLPLVRVRAIAVGLISIIAQASMRNQTGSIFDLHEPGSNLEQVVSGQLLESKRLTKDKISNHLTESLTDDTQIEPLDSLQDIQMEDLPTGLRIMFEKLDKGHIEAERIKRMEDLVRSYESLYMTWSRKHGAAEAKKRITDLLGLVEFDCTEASVEAKRDAEQTKSSNIYGSAMYAKLYDRLREREREAKVYNCRAEHLMGAAGVLTQNCKVWWSEQFDLVSARDT